jgi:hypothetical protein
MADVLFLARSSATAVWGLLIGATLLSWWMGTHELGLAGGGGALIILVAFVKVRLVAGYFMELRDAPTALRAVVDAYCLVVGGLLIGLLLA